MEITFDTKHLRTLCCSQEEAEVVLSVSDVKALRSWLADAAAAASFEELSQLHDVVFNNDVATTKVGENLVISFSQAHLRPPEIDGCINLAKVYRIKLLSIEVGRGDD